MTPTPSVAFFLASEHVRAEECQPVDPDPSGWIAFTLLLIWFVISAARRVR